jgi:hypothetical protein
VTPVFLFLLTMSNFIVHILKPVKFENYPLPTPFIVVGWILELLPVFIFCVPLCITIWKIYYTKVLTKKSAFNEPSQEWLDRQEEIKLQGKCFGF